MKAKITNIGNSRGIIIPKAIIEQCGLENLVDLEIENNRLIISPLKDNPRQGGEAAIIAAGESERR